jgi:hypothetical protein
VSKSLLPEITGILNNKHNYLERTTGLYCLQGVSEVCSAEFTREKVIPLILKLAKDPVPNVRFVTCKVFSSIVQ